MKDIEFVEVGFENFESIIIPTDRIKTLEFGKTERREKSSYADNAPTYTSRYLTLEIIYRDKSELIYDFRTDGKPLEEGNNSVQERPNILGRLLNFNDITDIRLLDENKKPIKGIYVPWIYVGDFDNGAMITDVSKDIISINIREET